jgi:hypothetical protein
MPFRLMNTVITNIDLNGAIFYTEVTAATAPTPCGWFLPVIKPHAHPIGEVGAKSIYLRLSGEGTPLENTVDE